MTNKHLVKAYNVQGQLFRSLDSKTVQTSFNGGKYWMSSSKSIAWFMGTINCSSVFETKAANGTFLG